MAKTRQSSVRLSNNVQSSRSLRNSSRGREKRKHETDNESDSGSDDSIGSEDSFVVPDNVIIKDTEPEEEDESDDDILDQMCGLRSSQKVRRSSQSSRQEKKTKKKKRIKIESSSNDGSDDDDGDKEDGYEESVQVNSGSVGEFKCYNPSCRNRVDTPKEKKQFCPRCALWEHPFSLAINDCLKNGDQNCFYCEQLRKLRGCKSMKYQNLDTLNPITIRRGESAADYPDRDQSSWQFYWNKFIKTSKLRFNIKLGDCLRIKEKKARLTYLIRVNYLFVDGKGETWISGYKILDVDSKEVSKFGKDDFEEDNRNYKKMFPTQKFLTKETSYYSLDQFEVLEVVCCVWYKEYYGPVRGFSEKNIFPFVFNCYPENNEIEFVDIPDWRVCKYEFIEKDDNDFKSVAVSTDDIIFEPPENVRKTLENLIPKSVPSKVTASTSTKALPPDRSSSKRCDTVTLNPAPIRVKQEPMDMEDDNVRPTEPLSQKETDSPQEGQVNEAIHEKQGNDVSHAAVDEDLEWPDEEEEEKLAQQRLARELLKTCMMPRTPLVIHPDIDLTEPVQELKISWKFPL